MSKVEELPEAECDAPSFDDGPEAREGSAGITAAGFRDFLLKHELEKAIVDCGFEHPSEVQHACISQAVLGTDILCQAKSGMGKTAVFVLACLQTVDVTEKAVRTLVLCHTRELAFQIEHEFKRLGKYVTDVRIASVFGGVPVDKDREKLKNPPHILVGTPARVKLLAQGKDAALSLAHVTSFVVDECDRCIDELDMRRDVQQIFIRTPKKKQVMMFSATISPETRTICKRFMQSPHEITVESEAKLTLHGLLQYYVKLEEKQKTKKLHDILDELEFNQVVVFVSSVKRAHALNDLLTCSNFPSMTLHALPRGFEHKAAAGTSPGANDDRITRLKMFKDYQKRILVTTDLFGRGMDVERVNIVINYDMPASSDMYLHRVGRAGRFGTKGMAITFAASEADNEVLKSVQSRFEVTIQEKPATVDSTSYLNA
eukprot:TRINITY_DN1123_c0_g1_i1.p1 TRINITY_DN1123_c0_g1~~TRINITY_DN1123_c0_g1_i1.p1  ORF type:complete len:445 (-),score=107.24 TRINITY_DN1123_c0_g1_i1:80-1369(-)